MTTEINHISISNHAGSVISDSSLPANTTSISTHAGKIQGRYTLSENLSLISSAGTINVEVLVNTNNPSPKA